jgi:hypothetical protein
VQFENITMAKIETGKQTKVFKILSKVFVVAVSEILNFVNGQRFSLVNLIMTEVLMGDTYAITATASAEFRVRLASLSLISSKMRLPSKGIFSTISTAVTSLEDVNLRDSFIYSIQGLPLFLFATGALVNNDFAKIDVNRCVFTNNTMTQITITPRTIPLQPSLFVTTFIKCNVSLTNSVFTVE